MPDPSARRLTAALALSALVLAPLCACSGASATTTASASETGTATGTETATETATTTTAETAASETGTTGAIVCEDPGPIELGACNPLDPTVCALPFPSLFHMRADAATTSGFRLAFAPTSLPANNAATPLDPVYLNEKDGFSILTPLIFSFADVALDGVIGHETLGTYTAVDAKTVLLDAETGERVPHFVELDMTGEVASERLLLAYPVTPLRHGARYVFGVRGLVTSAGEPVAISPAFDALRACAATEDPDVLGQRAHYEAEVFPVLAAAGFDRNELQIAWDFVTVTRESSLGRMEWIADDVVDAVGPGGPTYTVKNMVDDDCDAPGTTIGRTLILSVTTPRYTVDDAPDTVLTRDDAGMPVRIGETTIEAMIRIPCSLIKDPKPGRVLQYGHGLFGGYGEAKNGYLSAMANDNGWVIVAQNWTGMSDDDVISVVGVLLSDMTRFVIVPERSMQGFAEMIAVLRMVTGELADDALVKFGGVSVIDRERVSYYGNSQGGILGGAYLAASPDLTRGVLGVGGMPYALLLPRSADFDSFFQVLKMSYADHRDIIVNLMATQVLWDPGEGAGWAWALNREPSPGDEAKQVLIQVGLGDAQVANLGAHIQARAFQASTVAPQTRAIFGIPEKAPGFTGSGFVEWRYSDVPPAPEINVPPSKDTDTHECPRREAAAQAQLRDFLEDGVITQHCDGICEGVRAVTCG